MEKHVYHCNNCGREIDWDKETHWITSSYGCCDECYELMSIQDIIEITLEYE